LDPLIYLFNWICSDQHANGLAKPFGCTFSFDWVIFLESTWMSIAKLGER